MAECRNCRGAQKKAGHQPRQLHRLPVEVTQDKSFQRKGLPVALCPHCDGEALSRALHAHKSRAEN